MADEPKVACWRELVQKSVELGLGAAVLTKEAAAKLVEDLVKRGAVTKRDAQKLVAEMMEKGRSQKEKIESLVSEVAERALARADLARRSQVEELAERVAALEERLKEHEGG